VSGTVSGSESESRVRVWGPGRILKRAKHWGGHQDNASSHYANSRPLTLMYVRVSACFRDNFKLLHQLCARQRRFSLHLLCVYLSVFVCKLPSFLCL